MEVDMTGKKILFTSVIIIFILVFVSACDGLRGLTVEPIVPLPTYGTREVTASGTQSPTQPKATRQPSPTFDPDFWSNGNWISGWYWIRDDAFKNGANWFVEIPPGSADVHLKMTVLATEKASGGRGIGAVFYLTWGQAGGSQSQGNAYGRKRVELPNTSPASDPVGYTCTGVVTLTRTEISNATKLWLSATRSDPMGELPPSTVHVAFSKHSIEVVK